VKSGIYAESTLVINKSIWLEGEDQQTTKINLTPKWIEYTNPIPFMWDQVSHFENSLEITASDVKISGFTFSSNATSNGGLYLIDGNSHLIENNTFQNNSVFLKGSNEIFTLNKVRGSIECFSSFNVIAGNRVFGDIWVNNGNAPELMVAPHDTNLICGNTVTNGGGIAAGGDGNIVTNNKVINNTYGIGTAIHASNCIFGETR